MIVRKAAMSENHTDICSSRCRGSLYNYMKHSESSEIHVIHENIKGYEERDSMMPLRFMKPLRRRAGFSLGSGRRRKWSSPTTE